MIFGELPLGQCEGAILAHAVALNGQRIAKGAKVDSRLLAAAAEAGLAKLWVARPEPGDIPEAEAADRIARHFAGEGISVHPPVHGRVNLHALHAGLLTIATPAVAAANRVSDALALSTLPPFSPVAAGMIVATMKVIPYAVAGADLAAALAVAPAGIRVHPWRTGLRAILLQSRRADTADKQLAKAASVTRARLQGLGMEMIEAAPVDHSIAALADALPRLAAAADLLLIAGATATSDRRDVVPAAIAAAGGRVKRVGMPVDPGNLLVWGELGSAAIIGLPGCAKSPKRNGLDLLLERFAAGLVIDDATIAGLGVGGLLDEGARPVPWAWTAAGG